MELAEKFISEMNFNLSAFIFDILIPCFLALIFGGLIGFQREKADRPAGLRTHTLVCLGSTVLTLISYLGFSSMAGTDPSRIAAGVVTGIGFIGAGAIFRQGTLVKGITTAASIWIVAAIGMALGTKLYYLAVMATVLGFLTLSILKYVEEKIIKPPNYTVKITTLENFTEFDKLINLLKQISLTVESKKYEIDDENNKRILTVNISSKQSGFSNLVIRRLGRVKGIEKITVN